ncbi:MAG: hypothetical protein CFH08_01564 [Alphaproteobacteria bacterium MarineAlpha3_Bin7]|nr:MAG: hypothetical protein CFH08_01564 [Alphaproteobacteria bacterium MarineAlpha3_Bin7]|tara:strand:- start:2256 stop:2414 length:159 start_codon:yes stop_codon:yes gene_type:complete
MAKVAWKTASKDDPIYTGKVTFFSHNRKKEAEVWVESMSFSKPKKLRRSFQM